MAFTVEAVLIRCEPKCVTPTALRGVKRAAESPLRFLEQFSSIVPADPQISLEERLGMNR